MIGLKSFAYAYELSNNSSFDLFKSIIRRHLNVMQRVRANLLNYIMWNPVGLTAVIILA